MSAFGRDRRDPNQVAGSSDGARDSDAIGDGRASCAADTGGLRPPARIAFNQRSRGLVRRHGRHGPADEFHWPESRPWSGTPKAAWCGRCALSLASVLGNFCQPVGPRTSNSSWPEVPQLNPSACLNARRALKSKSGGATPARSGRRSAVRVCESQPVQRPSPGASLSRLYPTGAQVPRRVRFLFHDEGLVAISEARQLR